ncbi:MAG TPA: hypothetical protein PLV45_11585 [bacterium]|nr:hypothetical protein [bacterium]
MANTPLERLKQGNAPLGMRMAIAEGILPLEGEELVAALGYLIHDTDPGVVEVLKESLPTMPRGFLQSTAHHRDTSPELLHFMAETLIDEEEIVQTVILNRFVGEHTLIMVAEKGPPAVLEVLAQNRNKMLECPAILARLLENENLSRVTRYALEEFRERFQIDLDIEYQPVTEHEVEPGGEGDFDEGSGEPVTAVAVDDDVDTTSDVAAPDDLDLSEDDFAVEVEAGIDDETGVAAEIEDTLSDAVLESVKGFDDGWDIDTLVHEVGGDAAELQDDEVGGFDDLLDITVVEEDEDEDGEDDWLGEDISTMASREGLDEEEHDDDEDKEEVITDTRIRLMKMTASEKLIVAKMGTKQERAILVTDPNKKVAVAVVEGPKMSEFEVQLIASNRQVYEEVLRAIAQHREWGKSNAIRRELVLNPKTPLSISTRMLTTLNEFILKDVIKSKDVPNALVNHAKRVLEVRERRRGS